MSTRNARRGRRLAALLGLSMATAGVLTGCTGDQPPGPSSGPTSSTGTSSSPGTSTTVTPSPSSTPAQPDDPVAAATASAAAYLKESGYEVKATTPTSVTYVGDGTVTVVFTCAGGSSHEVGWMGLCSGGGKRALRMVAPARVVAGPKAEAVAMFQEDAAYCGPDGTPAWAKKFLKESSKEFCYLKESDG